MSRFRLIFAARLALTLLAPALAVSAGCGDRQPRPPAAAAEPRRAPPEAAPAEPSAAADAGRRTARRPRLEWSDEELADPEQIERRLLEDAKYLASDQLQGRGINTPGIELAAEHIARQYDRAGLRTNIFGGTPYHRFNYGTRTVAEDLRLRLTAGETARDLRLDEFSAFRRCRQGAFRLPLAFVGYGITAVEAGYDDYRSIDVRGKAVIVLRHEPRGDDGQPGLPRDRGPDKPSSHAYIDAKIANAAAHGAAAVLLCTDGAKLRERRMEGEQAADLDRLLRLNPRRGSDDEIPALHCRRSVVDWLLQQTIGKSLPELERAMGEQWQPQSAELDARAEGAVTIRRRSRQLKNVVGVLEGDGPLREETIVVGAHYDHLGMGGSGSLAAWTVAVHNGADDNASGVSAMLEVARQLAARAPLRRRVVFIAFSAEESGLIGSERYVRAPYVPLDETVAMLNLDMVGRLGRRLEVHGTGTAKEFSPLLDRLAPRRELAVEPYSGGYGPSDHASFYERGVPVLHLFTGLHRDYHRPSDDYQKLNLAGMRKIALLTADIATAVAEADTAPQRTANDLGLGDLSELTPAPRRRYKLGGRVADSERGVVLREVPPRTPAWLAGLRQGDVIVSCDGRPVRGAQQFVDLIRSAAGGTQVTLRILRGEVELELDVTLGNP